MKQYIIEFANKLKINNYTILQEDDHFYIMNENNTGDFILLQIKDDLLIVWSYDLLNVTLLEFCIVLENHFDNFRFVFPYIDSKKDMEILQNYGYTETDFFDPDVDDETRSYPSYGKRLL